MASQEGHLEIARLLLEANAGKDKIKNHGAIPVFMSNCKVPVLQKWKPPTFHRLGMLTREEVQEKSRHSKCCRISCMSTPLSFKTIFTPPSLYKSIVVALAFLPRMLAAQKPNPL